MSSSIDQSGLDELLKNYKPVKLYEVCELWEDDSNSASAENKNPDENNKDCSALNRSIIEDDSNACDKNDIKKGDKSDETETSVFNRSMCEDAQSGKNREEKSLSPEKENESPYPNPFFISKRLSFSNHTYSGGKNPLIPKFEFHTAKKILSEINFKNIGEAKTPMFQLKTPKAVQEKWTPFCKNSKSEDDKKDAEPDDDSDDSDSLENPFCVSKRLSFSSHTYSGKKNPFKFEFQTPTRTRKPSEYQTPFQTKSTIFQTHISQKKGGDSNHSITFPEVKKVNVDNLQPSQHQFKTPDVRRFQQNEIKIKKQYVDHENRQHNDQYAPSSSPYPYQKSTRTSSNEGCRPSETFTRQHQPIEINKNVDQINCESNALNEDQVDGSSAKKSVVKSLEFVEKQTPICEKQLSTIIEENSMDHEAFATPAQKNQIKITLTSPESNRMENLTKPEDNQVVNNKKDRIISPEWEVNYKREPVSMKNVKCLLNEPELPIENQRSRSSLNEPEIKTPIENQPPSRSSLEKQPNLNPNENFQRPSSENLRSDLVRNKIASVKDFKTLIVKKRNYILISKLGEGGTCQVFDCLEPETLQHRAIKIVNLSADAVIASGCVNEVKMLKALQGSEYVIKIFDFEISNNTLFVVMEKGGIDLSVFLKNIANKSSFLPIHVINYYWMEMLNCVKEIHDAGIIHSDLKPSNFLIVDGRLKLIDFGIASRLSSDMTSVIKNVQVGTFNYISPEALLDSGGCNSPVQNEKPRIKISYKSDVWSLGCILYQLVYRKTPFHNIGNTFAKISMIIDPTHQIEYPRLPHVSSRMIETINRCLQYDMKMRPTVAELIAMNNNNL